MNKLPSSANEAQLIEILNSMAFPVMGAGGGFAPIGTRAYFDGTLAPEGWLLCDGSTHNIADYPELASYFASHHGSSNCYGGNGTTTFATPVMNGMPSSGVDTPDEHIVGEHRELVSGVLKYKPVYEMTIALTEMSLASESWKTVYNDSNLNVDRIIIHSLTGANGTNYSSAVYVKYSSPNVQMYSIAGSLTLSGGGYLIIRYTKTTDTWQTVQEGHSSDGNGVFCVKATVAGDPNAHHYSTDEQVVGTWIDGRPVYEKMIEFVAPTGNNIYKTVATFTDVDMVTDISQTIIMAAGNIEYITPSFVYYKYEKSNGNLSLAFTTAGSLGGQQAYAVVRYVKTAS